MELALTTFMSAIGFTFTEILKMLVLVGLNFVFIGIIIWRFKGQVIDFFQTVLTAMKSIPELNKTLQEHIIQTDLRMDQGEERFKRMEQDIQTIKTHTGIK